MSATARHRWTVEQVVSCAVRQCPHPLRVSWSDTTRKMMGGAVAGAVRAGLLRRVRGAPGADWYEVVTVAPKAP